MRNNKKRFLIILIIFFVFSLGIGFATFSSNLSILTDIFVEPNENDFSVVLTTEQNRLKTTGIVVEKSDESIVTEDAVIDNSRYPTISNLSANLSRPGQSVTFIFYTFNNGEYDAYLTNINYKKLSNNDTKICTPLSGSDKTSVDNACESISFSMTVNGDTYNDSTELSEHVLRKGTSEEITITVEYDENGPVTSDGFSVDFSDIELIYGSVDSSFNVDPNTGNVVTKQYTLSYDTNGGKLDENDSDKKVITYNTKVGDLATPYKKGYTFKGWYTSKEYNELVNENYVYSNKSDMTIYAKWEANKYTITLNPLEGTLSSELVTKDVYYDSEYGELEEPQREGYLFRGWYLDLQFTKKIDSKTKVEILSDQIVYAKYRINKFTLTLDPNGGTVSSSTKEISYGKAYGALAEPQREGYSFAGWYTQLEGGELVNASSTVTNDSDHTLYAHWNANSFTLTFDFNGGTGTPLSKTVIYDSPYGDLPIPNKNGYSFDKWYKTNEFKDAVSAGDTVKITEDSTIYANWNANDYNITLNANGGKVDNLDSKVISVKYNSKYNLPTPTKYGYTFAGWYTAASGGDLRQNDTYITTASDQTLYAHWTANSHTLYYSTDGGTINPTSKSIIFDSEYGDLDTPTKTGYDFVNWYADSNLTTLVTKDTKLLTDSNVTIYAKWEAVHYTVTLDKNATDAVLNDTSLNVVYGSPYGEIEEPTRTGYVFAGWYTDKDNGTQITALTNVSIASNHTLYGRWTANKDTNYTVYHWKQKIGGNASLKNAENYDLVDTDLKKGETDKTVTAELNNYTGFDAPSEQTVKIKGDGSAVVNYYYTRKSYTLTISKGTGINTVTGSGNYQYQQNVSITYTLNDGYSYKDVTGDKTSLTFTMPASNTSVTVNGRANVYNISYDYDGGSANGTMPATGVYNSVVTINNPSKTGYSFKGWNVLTLTENDNAKYGSSSSDVTKSIESSSQDVLGN